MNPRTPSIFKKIGMASFIMMASVFASRVIGLVREMTIAWTGGAGAGVDAYQIAFALPEILNHVVASGFLSITFIPVFSRYVTQGRERRGFEVFALVFNGFGLILISGIVCAMIWTPHFVRLLAPGITDPATFDLAVRMTRIILPAQFFFFAGGLFMAVQFTKEKFLIPALAPLIYNLGIICGGVFLYPHLGMEGFAWGVLGGAFAGNFLLQWAGAVKQGLKFRFAIDFFHPDFIHYVKITLPFIVGLTVTFSTEILMKFFGSFLAPGHIAAMNYALRIMFILVGFFGQAIGMASYPFMAGIAATGDMDRLNHVINQTLKFIFLVIPFSILFMVLRYEIVMILFQRGAFDADATRLTAGVLPFFMAGAFAFSAQTFVARGFYALENTLFPALVTTGCMLAGLPVIYGCMKAFGVNGVALGLSGTVIVSTFVLFASWNTKTRNPGKNRVYLFLARLILASLGVGAIVSGIHQGLIRVIPPETFFCAFSVCIVTGLAFLVLMPVAGRLLNIPEIMTVYEKTARRLMPWQKIFPRT
ncbi:MAG: murein biosynthesis integral membrane protein MurJ [Thermodesulfobacteriota bacterium]